jgi:hypothetical protein
LFRLKRDYYAGALMILIGLVAAQDARNYAIGTLRHMGPGYFPVALGVILIFLGILIAGTASTGAAADQAPPPFRVEWRGWFCVIAGPILFIFFATFGGLLPATFACVFVSAFGDRDTTLKGATILAACTTVFGIVLFSYFLQIPMPIIKWGTP